MLRQPLGQGGRGYQSLEPVAVWGGLLDRTCVLRRGTQPMNGNLAGRELEEHHQPHSPPTSHQSNPTGRQKAGEASDTVHTGLLLE